MGKLGPLFRQIKNAGDDFAIKSSDLAGLPRQHGTQIRGMRSQTRGADNYEGPSAGNGLPATRWKDTRRGSNSKRTYYDAETGRPVRETGTIGEDFGSTRRGDNATEVGRLGGEGYDGGHLGAHRFFGDTPDEGIAPQASNLNRGAWKKMENEWADWADNGFQVEYTIMVKPPGSRRPDSFEVDYEVTDPSTGEQIYRHKPNFKNIDGQTFDRVSPSDIKDIRGAS